MLIQANIVDIAARRIYAGHIHVEAQSLSHIEDLGEARLDWPYALPGFVDAHIHIESSMLIPSEFARLATVHGTIATVSDPHEIANVLGLAGVEYMIDNGQEVPFYFNFGAPSCVPATAFETAGARLDLPQVQALLARPEIKYLAEMMNWPGVLYGDPEVLAKIAAAQALGKPVDGHAPGLRGEQAAQYIAAGMSTDHECFSAEEAADKLALGMKILIREGSAAKNYRALSPLIAEHYAQMMFCSDDKHPNDLIHGHINALVARALAEGQDLFKVLQMACLNPSAHYGLEHGLMRPGDKADFILVEDLREFKVLATYIRGRCVAEKGRSLIPSVQASSPNHFVARVCQTEDFALAAQDDSAWVRAIVAEDGELVTGEAQVEARLEGGYLQARPEANLLKIAVVNRYELAPAALAFIQNIGLKEGALASSVAHDSHNIVVVGCSEAEMALAVNTLMQSQGGVVAVRGTEILGHLPLPVAGLMSAEDGYAVAERYEAVAAAARSLGSPLHDPFMTLSFMALLVIPALKLSDKGLFDGQNFRFSSVYV